MLAEETLEDNLLIIQVEEKIGYIIVKRMFDLLASAIGLIILIPLFILVAIFIKLDDPNGSVFFYQTRVGKNGELFRMYKFRSMYSDAEERLESLLKLNEIEGAMFKLRQDPRVTKVGKFIRRTSIDELPQLFNVIVGNMSLVGPRPALPREVVKYSNYDCQRLLVTPGITGLWQVSGRNSLSFEQMVNLDITYIMSRSLSQDLILLLKTVKEVFYSANAF